MELNLPEHWQVRQVAAPALRAAGDDWADRLALALDQPVAGPTLGRMLAARPRGRVALVVEDVTRHSPIPRVLEVVLRELHYAGVGADRIEVVFATGMHQPMTARQAAEKLGAAGASLRWRSNPWADRAAYAFIGSAGKLPVWLDRGVATADVRIIISSTSPHLQAGFGGGWKMLLPGCARLETIRALHSLGASRRFERLVGRPAEQNAMRAAIDAGGQLIAATCGATYSVQFLLDEADRPAAIATGEVIPAHQMLTKQCAVACGVMTAEPADVVIANAWPRDYDLWQSFKCIPNTLWAARPGGVVICLTRCEAGACGMRVPPWPLAPARTRALVRWLGANTVYSLLTRLAPSLAGDAAFFVRLAAHTISRNPVIMVSPTLHAAAMEFPGLEIVGTMEQAAARADAMLGPGRRLVTVFPAGGITYPVSR